MDEKKPILSEWEKIILTEIEEAEKKKVEDTKNE